MFVELITVPLGGLVYHLVTLFAIYFILGVTFERWNHRHRDPTAIRLLVSSSHRFSHCRLGAMGQPGRFAPCWLASCTAVR